MARPSVYDQEFHDRLEPHLRTHHELLDTMPSPGESGTYEITVETDELTFLGKRDQVDFGHLTVTYWPSNRILELRSFKKYVQSFRERLYSYERLTNLIYGDLAEVLSPVSLTVSARFKPRGGAITTVRRSSPPR